MKPSQNEIVLAHLKSGRTITSWEAITLYRITRLSGRIQDLEEGKIDGINYNIKSELVKDPLTGKHYSRYRLVNKEIQIDFLSKVA